MQRRSFIQSLLTIPVVAVASRFVGHAAIPRNTSPPLPRPSVATLTSGKYAQFRAAAEIHKGDVLREHQISNGVVPIDGPGGGWFVGVAMHDAMQGDSVIAMTEGKASVRFQ
jgi:hypothetical protein